MFCVVQPGRVDKNDLRIFRGENSQLTFAGGLRARRNGGDLLPKQCIEQGGFPYIGTTDDGDEARTMSHACFVFQLAITRLLMMRTAARTICQVRVSSRKMVPSVTPPSGNKYVTIVVRVGPISCIR